MSRYDFWTHGVATVAEVPGNTEEIRPMGWGLRVRQRPNPPDDSDRFNWFHIPVPTPTVLDDDSEVALRNVRVRAELNENAEIIQIALHGGPRSQLIGPRHHVTLRGGVDHNVDVGLPFPGFLMGSGGPIHEINSALCVSVAVRFSGDDPVGEVLFQGAGARFDE